MGFMGDPPGPGSSSISPLPRHFYVPSFVRHPPIETAVLVWGVNEDYQLGLENPADQSRPKVLDAMLGIRLSGRSFLSRPIVAGSRHSLAIDAYGQVYTWGWNARATLGHGHREPESKPKKIVSLASNRVRIVQAAIGGWHCLAVSDQGQVYAWGGNEYEQCTSESTERDIIRPVLVMPHMRVRQVSAGGMHSVALTYEGEVWTWGEPWGEFALNLTRKPRKIEGLERVIKTACGAFHNLALTAEGTVYSWGTNDYGQLGSGDTSYSNVARPVVGLDDVPIIDISCGGWHSACITDKGEVFVWGRGEYGRLGLGDRSGSSKLRPLRVDGLLGHVITEVSCGGTHTLCLTQEGRVFVFGRADYGRLGLGDGAVKDLYVPLEIPMPGGNSFWKVISVAAGGRHTLCLALPDRSDEETDRRSSRNTTGPGSVSEMVPLEDLAASLSVQEPSLAFLRNISPVAHVPSPLPSESHRGQAEGSPDDLEGAETSPRGKSAEFEDDDEDGDWTAPVLGKNRTALDDMIDDISSVDPSSTLITTRNAASQHAALEEPGRVFPPAQGPAESSRSVDLMELASSGESIIAKAQSNSISQISRPPRGLPPTPPSGKTTTGNGTGTTSAGGTPNKAPVTRRISAIQLALERSGELDLHEEPDEDTNEF